MARLHSTGFELNSTTANVEATVQSNTVISTTLPRSGSYGIEQTPASALQTYYGYQFASAAGNGPFYLRGYFRINTSPSGTTGIMTLDNSATPTTSIASIQIDTNEQLILRDEDGQIGSNSSAIALDTWHMIELMVDLTGGGGSHVVRARLNGVEFAAATDRNLSAGVNHFFVGSDVDNNSAANAGIYYWDDIALNDSTGSFENSYPGSEQYKHLKPNATGDNEDWTNDYTNIDEITPDDVTTYIEGTASNQIEDVNLEASGLTTETIKVVHVGARYAASPAGSTTFVLRVKATSGGTVEESSNLSPGGTYVTNKTSAPFNFHLTLYDLPGASTTAWTPTELDTAQIGARVVTFSTSNVRVSTMWLGVGYAAAAGSASSSVSASVSPSSSVSLSPSVSVSASPSSSTSPSVSVSLSPSVSASSSVSLSPSASAGSSPSLSISLSPSVSASASQSPSSSISLSVSLSPSVSVSLSPSLSPSASTSPSSSVSLSPSPSTMITKGGTYSLTGV